MLTVLVFAILTGLPLLIDMRTRRTGPESLSRSTLWTGVYVATSLLFAGYLFWSRGYGQAMLFTSAYLTEKAMSIDNLIVFGSVFAYFGVKPEHQHRVLHWGILGSAVLRMVFIGLGLTVFFVFGRLMDIAFGLFVIWTSKKMFQNAGEDAEIDHNKRWYIRWARRILPTTPLMTGDFTVWTNAVRFVDKFTVVGKRRLAVTPLLFCLIALEFTDLAFAFDSMPAVVGLTRDPVLAYSATMFAVIGLRSMYFVLEALSRYTASLATSVMAILCFVGVRMVLHGTLGWELPVSYTLGFIIGALVFGVVWPSATGPGTEAA